MDTAVGAGLHRVADLRTAPARRQSWPGPGRLRLRRGSTPRLAGNDRGAALPDDDPGVRGDPERSAWQLPYVTLCHPWHDIRMDPASDIRSTRWDVKRVNTPLTWEPVSGFEPLTCRLQDGCS